MPDYVSKYWAQQSCPKVSVEMFGDELGNLRHTRLAGTGPKTSQETTLYRFQPGKTKKGRRTTKAPCFITVQNNNPQF